MRDATTPRPPYHLVALDLAGRRVAVVGAGQEAVRRATALLEAGARVELYAPSEGSVAAFAARTAVHWFARPFTPDDARGVVLVLHTDRERDRSVTLRRHAHATGALFAAVDDPEVSDFIHPAIARRGPVSVAVSTHGQAPALARVLREALDAALDERFVAFADRVAAIRRTTPRERLGERMRELLEGLRIDLRLTLPPWFTAEGAARPDPYTDTDPR
ncbi:MAG: bifunctional precorrin-2 dehydrogenase/sirohydrochlorin ferrochelatase [Myxococcota bacterium]|nr:bifunctional precorrin-2 dehydrogenase/sirohydrochlorin ferrochelatase [Myxococcota bacterium]MDW8363025.1 bifunctional precorrin-2 dehydrogenase/sirohydrochlorin ferrochelatase [Myxococcales bacterium]